MRHKITINLLIQLLIANVVYGQVGIVDQNARRKPTIVFIGTYHMGGEGNNTFKGSYDDILSPKRQQELQILIQKLKDFKPTKVVIERDVVDSARILKQYRKYLKGKHQLTRNETEQIGFRLAKELNHQKVHCVDWGIFPKDPLYNYANFAKSNPKLKVFLSQWKHTIGKKYKQKNKALLNLPIIDRIRKINQKEYIEEDHQGYFDIMRIGLGDKYAGANYLSWWYGRNMKILVNIIRITESADDRILVIYGVGHAKLLNQLTKESQFYNVIEPAKILKD